MDNPKAFPSIEYNQNEGHYDGRYTIHAQSSGMSLRDWFAGQIASGYFVTTNGEGINPSHAAKFIYECADAMLAEKEK